MLFGEKCQESCPGIDILSVSSLLRLLLRGGIKISSGNTYLKSPLPEIILENSLGNEIVSLNGTPLKRTDTALPVWQLPETIPVNEILKIEAKAGDQELRRVLRIEEPSLPLSFNLTLSRTTAGSFRFGENQPGAKVRGVTVDLTGFTGKMPFYPHILPFHLSERIVFIGQQPGQITNWPNEGLPAWHPVWAIAKKGHREWEAHFCGVSEQGTPGSCKTEPFGSVSDRKQWKEALWVNRKTTSPPQLKQLGMVWKEYMEAAKNV